MAARTPLVHLVMPIHRVLSSASIMRLTAPGCPSLMETGLRAVLLAQIDDRQIAGEERLALDLLRLLAHDVHGGCIDQRVAGAAGNGDGGSWPARRSWAVVPESWPRRKIIGATGSRRDRRIGPAALRAAIEDVGGSAIRGKDGLYWAVEGQRGAVIVAGRIHVIGALRLKQAPAGSILRLAIHRGLGPGGRTARVSRWSAQRELARIIDVIGILDEGQGDRAAGIHADAIDAGKAEGIDAASWFDQRR